MNIYIGFFLSVILGGIVSCDNGKMASKIYYNGARTENIDSSKVQIYLNGGILVDTMIANYRVDTYILIKEFALSKDENNVIHLSVNEKDTTFRVPKNDVGFQLFFFFDNKTKLRRKMLDALSFWPRRDPDSEHVRDSIYKVYGNSLDSLHIHFKYD
ncbi:hypothetical protein [Sphingobacterium pedocola]|uniref:DUF4369 domain-containing protein n=1 Tax=Sphingobacterium pedocola TaxID=2082722 RepID=A0ABR9T2S5_9SPHI|nr:hypothetical protein [Sphingobacterium pedocola]MBE8719639.1 hypothetical protein [Sphingobacterium pedocola]